jgi:hypothetical protein
MLLFLLTSACKTPSRAGDLPEATKTVIIKVSQESEDAGLLIFRPGHEPELRPSSNPATAAHLKDTWKEIQSRETLSLTTERVEGSKRYIGSLLVKASDADYPYAVYEALDKKFEVSFGELIKRLVVSKRIGGSEVRLGRIDFHPDFPVILYRVKTPKIESETLKMTWQNIAGKEVLSESENLTDFESRYAPDAMKDNPGYVTAVQKTLQSKGYSTKLEEEIR